MLSGPFRNRTFSFCAPGVTYPVYGGLWDLNGVSACMINGTQNSKWGSKLNSELYVPLRIINNDPFYVQIDL